MRLLEGFPRSVLRFRDVEKGLRERHPGLISLGSFTTLMEVSSCSVSGAEQWEWIQRLFVSRSTRGGYVLGTVHKHLMKHAIVVDARGGYPMIFDCADWHPMTVTKQSLFLCCSTSAPLDFLLLDDMFRIFRPCSGEKEPKWKRPRVRHKSLSLKSRTIHTA